MLKITPLTITQNAKTYNQMHLDALAHLQAQISSGQKYQMASDNPVATAQIRRLESSLATIEVTREQYTIAQQRLNTNVTELLNIQDLLTRAKSIALEGAQSNDTTTRETLASEVQSLIDQVFSIANASHAGVYSFSGTATRTRPFSIDDTPGLPIPQVQYHGSGQRGGMAIGQELYIDTYYTGTEVFFSRERGATHLLGDETGLALASGTDSGVGRATIDVVHTTTTYAGASGVQPGTSSGHGDTVLGPLGRHSLTINDTSGAGAFGTVRLNNGTEVAFTSADTNLQVIDEFGREVFIDTTSISAGFSGTVDLESNGSLTIDGGNSTTPIDFSSFQILTQSSTGHVTHVDSSQIHRTGTNHVEYEGTSDVLTSLIELKHDLLNARGLDEGQFESTITRRIQDIDRGSDRILDVVGEQSAGLSNLETLAARQESLELTYQQQLVEYGSADISEVVLEMQTHQSLIQFTYAAISIIQDVNILNFLG